MATANCEARSNYLIRYGRGRGEIQRTASVFFKDFYPVGLSSKSKFRDVPLYRKHKYGGCQSGSGSNCASSSETGRKDIPRNTRTSLKRPIE